jgi:hypothetical protein
MQESNLVVRCTLEAGAKARAGGERLPLWSAALMRREGKSFTFLWILTHVSLIDVKHQDQLQSRW